MTLPSASSFTVTWFTNRFDGPAPSGSSGSVETVFPFTIVSSVSPANQLGDSTVTVNVATHGPRSPE